MPRSTASSAGSTAPGTFDQFLQPQSMVTPGALGSLAMVGTNALGGAFDVTPESFYYAMISVLISFVFGLTAIVKSASIVQKFAYYMINSLIIFSVAAGANTIGRSAQQHLAFRVASPAYAAPAASVFEGQGGISGAAGVAFFKEWFPTKSGKSTICLFSSGPRAGERQDLAPKAALEVGEPCSDGKGNSGKIVAP